MDGRVQLPVLEWIKAHYPVDFVDVITEAGMDGHLAKNDDLSRVLQSIKISTEVNNSTRLFVVGHYDCRGNPVDEARHRRDISGAVERLKPLCTVRAIAGLWVNDRWQVEQVC